MVIQRVNDSYCSYKVTAERSRGSIIDPRYEWSIFSGPTVVSRVSNAKDTSFATTGIAYYQYRLPFRMASMSIYYILTAYIHRIYQFVKLFDSNSIPCFSNNLSKLIIRPFLLSVLTLNPVFYLILYLFNRIKIRAKRRLKDRNNSTLEKVGNGNLYSISRCVILYKFQIRIYTQPAFDKRNNPFIIAFGINLSLFLFPEQVRTLLVSIKATLKYLAFQALNLIEDIYRIQLFAFIASNILFLIAKAYYLSLIRLKNKTLLILSLINMLLGPRKPFSLILFGKRWFLTRNISLKSALFKSILYRFLVNIKFTKQTNRKPFV